MAMIGKEQIDLEDISDRQVALMRISELAVGNLEIVSGPELEARFAAMFRELDLRSEPKVTQP